MVLNLFQLSYFFHNLNFPEIGRFSFSTKFGFFVFFSDFFQTSIKRLKINQFQSLIGVLKSEEQWLSNGGFKISEKSILLQLLSSKVIFEYFFSKKSELLLTSLVSHSYLENNHRALLFVLRYLQLPHNFFFVFTKCFYLFQLARYGKSTNTLNIFVEISWYSDTKNKKKTSSTAIFFIQCGSKAACKNYFHPRL